jgi:hypothetical protein
VTGSGELIAVWQSAYGSTIEGAGKPEGGAWSTPTAIFTSPSPPQSGTIADLQVETAPDGEAFAVWRGFDGTGWVIEAATRPATWS